MVPVDVGRWLGGCDSKDQLQIFSLSLCLWFVAARMCDTPTHRAAVHFEKGDYDAAIADCDKAVERGRELRTDYSLIARALARKANSLVKLGKLEEAVAAYNKSLMEHRTADTLKRLNETERKLKVGLGLRLRLGGWWL